MKNSNRVLVSNGDKRYQRELVTALRNKLDVNFFDVEVSYDFYRATVEATDRVAFVQSLSQLMDSETEYKHNYLFVIDDFTPKSVEGAWEMLFRDFNSLTKHSFNPNWVVFFMASSPRDKIDLDAKLLARTVVEGYKDLMYQVNGVEKLITAADEISNIMSEARLIKFTRG